MADFESDYADFRAPVRHGESLIQPGLVRADSLLRNNRQLADGWPSEIVELRQIAREQLVSDAIRYTGTYRDTSWVNERTDSEIILAGHQPTLFHPGVWFKNFALHEIGVRTGALPINLVIDNDVASGCSVRVPNEFGQRVSVPYDRASGGVPYEQTEIVDRALYDTFDVEVAKVVRGVVPDPSVEPLWKHARAALKRCGFAGCAMAQARHGLEGELGRQSLEVPLGVAVRGLSFAKFVLLILRDYRRFWACYNDSAVHYRVAHGIRSRAHPVPNLGREGDWWEAPLWLYGNSDPQRRQVWVRHEGDTIVISDRSNPSRDLRLEIDRPNLAAEQLVSHASGDFKLRPRALLTTMYARLVLSDLFIHGIGGAKYDQLGNNIVRMFFGIEPAEMMAISATVLLPGISDSFDAQGKSKLLRQIRQTRFQGERFSDFDLPSDLIQRKNELLQSIPGRGEKKKWHDEMTLVNRQMSSLLEPLREQFRSELQKIQADEDVHRSLASREHPFCVFPLDYLTSAYERMLS